MELSPWDPSKPNAHVKAFSQSPAMTAALAPRGLSRCEGVAYTQEVCFLGHRRYPWLKMLTPLETGRVPASNPRKSPANNVQQTVACLSGFELSKLPTPGEFREITNHLAAIILKQMQESPLSHTIRQSRSADDDTQHNTTTVEEFCTTDVPVPLLHSRGGDGLQSIIPITCLAYVRESDCHAEGAAVLWVLLLWALTKKQEGSSFWKSKLMVSPEKPLLGWE